MDGSRHLGGAKSRQPDDPGMWHFLENREFTEILVQGDQNSAFRVCGIENGGVTRVFIPRAAPNDIMPPFFQGRQCAAPYSGVQKDGRHQDASTEGKSSMRSWRANREA